MGSRPCQTHLPILNINLTQSRTKGRKFPSSVIRNRQNTADGQNGIVSTARQRDIQTCLTALGINLTGGTSQQNSPDQLIEKQSTSKELGLKYLE